MKILNLKVDNYKSINNLVLDNLNEKVNIFAGKNNVGKTTLIEVLYLALNSPNNQDSLVNNSNFIKLELEILVDDLELEKLNEGLVSEETIIGNRFYIYMGLDKVSLSTLYIDRIEVFNNFRFIPLISNETQSSGIRYVVNFMKGGQSANSGRPIIFVNFRNFLKEKIFYISGTRYVPKVEQASVFNSLNIDGTNLNAFLYTLHNNDELMFDKIVDVFKKIFNDVTAISTPINSSGTYISLNFDGSDEPIPLSSCGSGFTHVLILLCVLLTKRECVVLFDEPHAFLHPSAEKAIYDLISEIGDHQYFLTTHSPLLINYPFSKSIFLVKKENGNSIYTKLDSLEEVLQEIGLNNSDFALADKVLFVEGETEEAVIPLILDIFGIKQIGYNYRILKMNGTGNEFIKKSAMTRNKEKLDLILGNIKNSPIPYKIIILRRKRRIKDY